MSIGTCNAKHFFRNSVVTLFHQASSSVQQKNHFNYILILLLISFGFEGNFCDSDCSNSETDNGDNGVQVKYYPQKKNILATLMPTYVNKIVENLPDRFQDSGIVEKMKIVLPAKISQVPKNDLAKYGVTVQSN